MKITFTAVLKRSASITFLSTAVFYLRLLISPFSIKSLDAFNILKINNKVQRNHFISSGLKMKRKIYFSCRNNGVQISGKKILRYYHNGKRAPEPATALAQTPFLYCSWNSLDFSSQMMTKYARRKQMNENLFFNRPFHSSFMATRFHKMSSSNAENSISDEDKNKHNEWFLSRIQESLCKEIIPLFIPNNKTDQKETFGSIKSPLIIILAVSGGCDSVALFHGILQILNPISESSTMGLELKLEFSNIPCQVHVAHFDHGLRGEDSDGDRIFVKELCNERNIPFHAYVWGHDQYTSSSASDDNAIGNFSQESARDWRRLHLIQLLNNLTLSSSLSLPSPSSTTLATYANNKTDSLPGIILTAHHADDSDETLLLKLLRGTHISNLSGLDAIQLYDNVPSQFGKPMLHLRKKDIMQFLTSQNLSWREDQSNASNKYRRNRIRNELLPLMADIAGGNEILHKRFKNLSEQSQLLKHDLKIRSDEYLKEHQCSRSTDFLLPNLNCRNVYKPLNLVQQEALHRWAARCMNWTHNLSFDQMRRICKQIESYPERKKWTLNIGKGWSILRLGDILQIHHTSIQNSDNRLKYDPLIAPYIDNGNTDTTASQSWVIVEDDDEAFIDKGNSENVVEIALQIPNTSVNGASTGKEKRNMFEILSVYENEQKVFTPSWRSGRNPIKIKEFLRGQKIPLHRRGTTSIICMKDDESNKVLAVYVEKERGDIGEWMIGAEFSQTDFQGKNTILRLKKKS